MRYEPTWASDRRRRTSPDAVLNVVSSIRSIECQSPSLYSVITGTNSIPPEVERLIIARYAETVWRSPFESMTVN